MKTKAEIVENWLPRYTQHPLSDFGEYILLTNFNNYVDIFCEQFKLPQPGYGANMRMATAENITIINFEPECGHYYGFAKCNRAESLPVLGQMWGNLF